MKKDKINYFHFIDNWFKRKKKEIKDYTRLDFFDWGNLILFILGIGLLIELQFLYEISLTNLITQIILWFTGIAILQYTKETYWLKQVEQKNLNFEKAPLVVIRYKPNKVKPEGETYDRFILRNIGRGLARNVSWKITNIKGINDAKKIEQIKLPNKTIISPIQGGADVVLKNIDVALERLKPNNNLCYEVEIEYENIDKVKYFTKLKSGTDGDGYEITDWGKLE